MFTGARILHLHGLEQLKQAGWGSILENASRGLHVQLGVSWLYMKVIYESCRVFPSFNFVMSAAPHSAEHNPLWMGLVHVHMCFAELRSMALMVSVCEIRE